MGKLGLSATEIGLRLGASAMEVNRLLKDQGFLYGEPGAYGLTSKGEDFGFQRSHGNGYHGSYNVSWDSTHLDPRIMEVLDASPEKLAKVRSEISAQKQARKAARKIEQAEADANFLAVDANKKGAETPDEIDPQKVMIAVASALVLAGAAYGVGKCIEWYKRKKTEKAGQEETGTDSVASIGVQGD